MLTVWIRTEMVLLVIWVCKFMLLFPSKIISLLVILSINYNCSINEIQDRDFKMAPIRYIDPVLEVTVSQSECRVNVH